MNLRTPMTVMQGNLEGMLDGLYQADEALFAVDARGNRINGA